MLCFCSEFCSWDMNIYLYSLTIYF
jgi:hypothetical protein